MASGSMRSRFSQGCFNEVADGQGHGRAGPRCSSALVAFSRAHAAESDVRLISNGKRTDSVISIRRGDFCDA